jgi:RND family efflux transporter MFP subunit
MKRCLPLAFGLLLLAACGEAPRDARAPAAALPALTVTTVAPQQLDWPQTFTAGGNVAAWQETVIGPEISGHRIVEVKVNVGDVVARGQTLALIAPETVDSEYAETRASVAEAEALLSEARANHERARQLREKGFFSAQQLTQTQAAADTAMARLDAAKARLQTAELKKSKTVILAPDNGTVSARSATVGAIVQPGQELFRLIRGSRLEWRAEVGAADLARIKAGQQVALTAPGGGQVEGVVRALAPTVDPRTATAVVYVDLPAAAAGKISAGMFARGEFLLGARPALTLPQSALLLREGFAYVYRIDGNKVTQTKVTVGRRLDDRVELAGIDAGARFVASGVGFLADGDTVRIVENQDAPGKP